jgi:hypothetical protein
MTYDIPLPDHLNALDLAHLYRTIPYQYQLVKSVSQLLNVKVVLETLV